MPTTFFLTPIMQLQGKYGKVNLVETKISQSITDCINIAAWVNYCSLFDLVQITLLCYCVILFKFGTVIDKNKIDMHKK